MVLLQFIATIVCWIIMGLCASASLHLIWMMRIFGFERAGLILCVFLAAAAWLFFWIGDQLNPVTVALK